MGLTIFATRDGNPVFCTSRHCDSMAPDDALARWERGESPFLENPDYTPGAGMGMIREILESVLDLLDLPQAGKGDGTHAFDVRQVMCACDEALDRFDERLAQRGFGFDLRDFWLKRVMQIRDIAVVGMSQGADTVVAR